MKEMHGTPPISVTAAVDRDCKPLSNYAENVYSQYGEDGVIAEILRRLGSATKLNGWCAEFGAWDGVYLSNTCRLIREKSYSAVLIEGDFKRAEDLSRNFPQQNVLKICKFVNFGGENSLDRIFSETAIPADFDFLSIDVDGVDYHIFESLRDYRPKVVCIEFNPSIPNAVDFVQARDFAVKQGSSGRALTRLARSKGYSLVSASETNLFLLTPSTYPVSCPLRPSWKR